MRHRLLKYLRRLLVVALVLGALGVAAFTWLCYWPLEGKVDDALALVPEELEFVLRADWTDLEGAGWIQETAFEDPLHPWLAENAEARRDELRATLEDIERQINDNIPLPFEWARFGVEKDVLQGEVLAAGNFCRGFGPDRGVPRYQEILLLKRVSWRTRCIAALKHGFVRERLGPRLTCESEGDEIYKLTLADVPVSPREHREGCGGGFVVPPENEWYVRRCKDVLAISNSEPIIRRVAELAEADGPRGSFAARPGFQVGAEQRQVVAGINMEALKSYLVRAAEHFPEIRPLRRFLEPDALEKVNGYLSFAATDLLAGGGEISYVPSLAPDVSRAVYSLADRPVREGIATFVPAKDTFALLSLRVVPDYLLKSLVEDVLTPADRQLWEDNVRRQGEFESLDDFFEDLSTRVDNQAMVAVGRLSSVFDRTEYARWYAEDVDPMPLLAIMVRVKEGADQNDLDAYLSAKVPLLGMSEKLTRLEYRGFTYSRAEIVQKMADFALLSPCFILAHDHLIFTNNETYMRQILDTAADRSVPSLASDETFQVTMGALADRAHLALFVDLEKLTRVPQTAVGAPGEGQAGLLWDERNSWVIEHHDTRAEAIRYRELIRNDYPRNPNAKQQVEMEDRVDRHIEEFKEERYGEFLEERRRELEGLRRLRGLGVTLGATSDTLSARFAVVFREAEDWLRWRRR